MNRIRVVRRRKFETDQYMWFVLVYHTHTGHLAGYDRYSRLGALTLADYLRTGRIHENALREVRFVIQPEDVRWVNSVEQSSTDRIDLDELRRRLKETR